jgi:poly-gamma-glutamate capsule biosynthesis protein CapA/YwtB (metallophosphatase superfamily)
MGNLEGPITQMMGCQKKAYSFRFSPNIAKLLNQHGFDSVNIANNHSNDCYRIGFTDTKNFLNNVLIDSFGSHLVDESFIEKKIGETSVAIIGIDETTSSMAAIELFYKKITELKKTNKHITIIHYYTSF